MRLPLDGVVCLDVLCLCVLCVLDQSKIFVCVDKRFNNQANCIEFITCSAIGRYVGASN